MILAGALIFDLDGLLVDSEPLWFEVERAFAAARGAVWTAELWHDCIGKGLKNTLDVMRDALGLPIEHAADGVELVDRFLARASEVVLKPGCRELLDAAHGAVPIAIGSSSARRLVFGVVHALGAASYFDAIVTGDDVVSPKPAPDIFLEASRRLGVPPSDCVVLEDSLAGATAGHAAKMHVIAVPERPTEGLAAVSSFVVRDLFEARGVLVFPR